MPPGPASTPLQPTRGQRGELRSLVGRHRAPHAVVQRAKILLLAHAGVGNEKIARTVDCSSRNARKWRMRFAASPCLASIQDQPKSGRPARITVALRCQLIELACARPSGLASPPPFRDVWTLASLAAAFTARTGVALSVSEVGRILRNEQLRPHRIRQWLKSEDPNFYHKAQRICRLYLHAPKDAVVVCVDEKPLQVIERKHPDSVDPRDGAVRREYEYIRHGTQALLAAFHVKTGRVFARVVPHRNAAALVAFMTELARQHRGKKVIVIWDNLNIHYDGAAARWTQFNRCHGRRFRFVYTPIHASWMNQVEVWFSILQRRVIKHGNFSSAIAQQKYIEDFVDHWNAWELHPFRWTWRGNDRRHRQRAPARNRCHAVR